MALVVVHLRALLSSHSARLDCRHLPTQLAGALTGLEASRATCDIAPGSRKDSQLRRMDPQKEFEFSQHQATDIQRLFQVTFCLSGESVRSRIGASIVAPSMALYATMTPVGVMFGFCCKRPMRNCTCSAVTPSSPVQSAVSRGAC